MDETVFFVRLEQAAVWRKRELADIALGVQEISSKSSRFALMRAGIVMCYAHWEGFVRDSSELFMRYLGEQRLGVSQLKKNFVALLNTDGNERDFNYARHRMRHDRAGNLGSKELRKIIWQLGLDYRPFESSQTAIESLVKRRNSIAHGECTGVGEEEYKRVIDDVRKFMELFETQIDCSVREQRYLDNAPRP